MELNTEGESDFWGILRQLRFDQMDNACLSDETADWLVEIELDHKKSGHQLSAPEDRYLAEVSWRPVESGDKPEFFEIVIRPVLTLNSPNTE